MSIFTQAKAELQNNGWMQGNIGHGVSSKCIMGALGHAASEGLNTNYWSHEKSMSAIKQLATLVPSVMPEEIADQNNWPYPKFNKELTSKLNFESEKDCIALVAAYNNDEKTTKEDIFALLDLAEKNSLVK